MFESLTAWPLKNFCQFFLFNKSLSKHLKTKLGGSRCDTNFANPAQFAFACQCIENLIWPFVVVRSRPCSRPCVMVFNKTCHPTLL